PAAAASGGTQPASQTAAPCFCISSRSSRSSWWKNPFSRRAHPLLQQRSRGAVESSEGLGELPRVAIAALHVVGHSAHLRERDPGQQAGVHDRRTLHAFYLRVVPIDDRGY